MTLRVIILLLICTLARKSSAKICTTSVCEFRLNVRNDLSMLHTGYWKKYPVEAHNHTHCRIKGNSFETTSEKIGSYVEVKDVISADGTEKRIITVNGQFPAPTIEVMEGAKVVVHVENNLVSEPLSIHWHGIVLKGNPWMDGVAYITQCPIPPRQSFTYTFIADPPGTHWYHSHFMTQRMDGLSGALLVHRSVPVLTYYPVLTTEWYPMTAATMFLNNPFLGGGGYGYLELDKRPHSVDEHELSLSAFYSALINGRGRLNESDELPRTVFKVPNNSEVEFNLVGASGDYTFEISIDDHQLSVVSSDGYNVVPMTVDSVIIAPGETYDVRIFTDKAPASYWFRARTLKHHTGLYTEPDGIIQEALAIVRYEYADPDIEPTTQPKDCSPSEKCTILNCPYPIYPPSRICVSVAQLQSVSYTREFLQANYGLDDDLEDLNEYYFNFAFFAGAGINSRRFMMPRAPMFMGEEYIEKCDEDLCNEEGCFCTHIQDLPVHETIQFVITSQQPDSLVTQHTVHLHGYSFAIVKIGYFNANETTGRIESPTDDIKCDNKMCTSLKWTDGKRPELNLDNPPLKDSFILPPNGYAIIRFRTNNPGFWFFHCHQEGHVSEGMALLFKEGDIPDPPKDFPTCHEFNKELDLTDKSSRSKSTLQPKAGETTKMPDHENDDDDETSYMKDGYLMLKFGAAVGIMFGLILCGAVLAVCPLLTYLACRGKNKGGNNSR